MAFNIAYTYQLIDKYTAPIQKIVAATRAHTKAIKEQQAAIKAANSTLTLMANRAERLGGSLKALEGNNALKHLTGQAKALNAEMEKMARAKLPGLPGAGGGKVPGVAPGGGAHGGGRAAAHSKFSRFGAAASGLAGVGAVSGMSSVLKQTAAVENAMIDLGRATDLPAKDLKAFEERFMSLSEQIGISTDKLAIMAFEGSKTGIDTKDLDKYVKLTANAAVSFEILEDEAGRALGSIKAKMGLNIDQLKDMMDRVNFVADATSADGSNMINIIERLSGTFKTLKIPPNVAAGFAAVADQLETSPELAASGMNMVINKMMQSSVLAKKMFAAPADTMKQVFGKLAKMPEAERIAAATKMFGAEAGRFAVKLAGNMELFDETMKKAADSKAVDSMAREMDSKLNSLTMLWNNMKNAVTNVMVAIGEGLAPDIKRFGEYMREIVPQVRDFVREHPGFLKIAAAVAAVVAAITLAAPIVWALGAAFSFVGAAAGLLSLPVLAVAAAVAGAVMRWDEWVQAGHPVVEVITSIHRRVGHIIDRFKEFDIMSDGSSKSIKFLAKAFDWLAEFIALPLKGLDLLLAGLEKLLGIQEKIQPLGMLTDTESSLSKLMPPNIKAATSVEGLMGGAGGGGASVNGTITVKAEPGTKASVKQPNLPTGSNLLMVR